MKPRDSLDVEYLMLSAIGYRSCQINRFKFKSQILNIFCHGCVENLSSARTRLSLKLIISRGSDSKKKLYAKPLKRVR